MDDLLLVSNVLVGGRVAVVGFVVVVAAEGGGGTVGPVTDASDE